MRTAFEPDALHAVFVAVNVFVPALDHDPLTWLVGELPCPPPLPNDQLQPVADGVHPDASAQYDSSASRRPESGP